MRIRREIRILLFFILLIGTINVEAKRVQVREPAFPKVWYNHKRTNTYVRFGYDYYVYVNSPLLFQLVDGKDCYNIDFIEMVYQNGLYLK